MDVFDQAVGAVWQAKDLPANTLPGSQDDLLRFGELARDLVSVTYIKPPDPKRIGTRLRVIQRQLKGDHKSCQAFEIMSLPDSEPTTQKEDDPPDMEVVDPKVVVLLHSVALNVLFATSSCKYLAPSSYTALWIDNHQAIQDVEDSGSLQRLFGTPASMNRSSAIVKDYLNLNGKGATSHDSGIGMESPLEDPTSPWTLGINGTTHYIFVALPNLTVYRCPYIMRACKQEHNNPRCNAL